MTNVAEQEIDMSYKYIKYNDNIQEIISRLLSRLFNSVEICRLEVKTVRSVELFHYAASTAASLSWWCYVGSRFPSSGREDNHQPLYQRLVERT